MMRYTKCEKTGLWQLPIVFSVFKHNNASQDKIVLFKIESSVKLFQYDSI